MASSNKTYVIEHQRYMCEWPESYTPDGFHPVHLGDVLNGRYAIFRKLGSGSQSTVWLARDKMVPERRFVAIKVFGAKTSQTEIKLEKVLQPSTHPGKRYIEIALNSFIVHGLNGNHFCKVLEPLAGSLHSILYRAIDCRARLNEPENWRGRVLDGDPWSEKLAKRACYQIILGLDYLHTQRIAHRDIRSSNVCVTLEYDISSLNENEIQRQVWSAEKEEETETEQSTDKESETDEVDGTRITSLVNETSSDSDTDSDDSYREEWHRKKEERKKVIEAKWHLFEDGDKLAEPHSIEWMKANFLNTQEHIELLERTDGQPIQPGEIHYTVEATPLVLGKALQLCKSTRLVLIDLGFACSFEDCEKLPLYTQSIFRPPEHLLALPVTHKGDIFSAGLLCWEIVMLCRLIEEHCDPFHDPERVYQKNRQLRDLVQRIGPFPQFMRAQWTDADKFIDTAGLALDIQELPQEIYGPEEICDDPDDFAYGDIRHQAKQRKPLDMSDPELELFISLIEEMLQFDPELRPSTTTLLQHEWFTKIE